MVAAAVVGAGVIGAGASLAASSSQSSAAKNASDAQVQAAQLSIDEQRRQYDLARSDLAPYREFGGTALGELSALYGIGRNGLLPLTAAEAAAAPRPVASVAAPAAAPTFAASAAPVSYQYQNAPPEQQAAFRNWLRENGIPDWSVIGTGDTQPDYAKLASLWSTYQQQAGGAPAAPPAAAPAAGAAPGTAPANALLPTNSTSVEAARNRFTTSPGYQFRLGEGIKAAEHSAAARGLLGSGSTLKAVQRYGEGLASNEFENYANRLASIAGIGQTATNSTVAAGAQSAGAIGNALTESGNARASSFIGQGNAAAAGFAGVGNAANSGVNNFLLYQYLNRTPTPGFAGVGAAPY